MKKRHINIPVFIPHLGCPNDCVFCNQRFISGVKEFSAHSVIPIIEEALSTVNDDDFAEIAFFGGSFTGIAPSLMEDLLIIANRYLMQGRISSIRCSTRPDYIDTDILNKLSAYGVTTVELGIQSVSDHVLGRCKRGHLFASSIAAAKQIKDFGMKLGCQLMIGLPGASPEDELETAKFIVAAGADEARIYPTLVFKQTELCAMTERGEYVPLTLDEAVKRSAKVFSILLKGGVKILRIGLCDSENLHSDTSYHSGPNHAAMGELVVNEYYYDLISEELIKMSELRGSTLTVTVAKGHTSKAVGQLKKNKIRLLQNYGFADVKFSEDASVAEYTVALKVEERI